MGKKYDLAVIGAGPAGYEAAIRAAQLHLSVALVENREPGGTCLNRGCIPTKTILHSAGLYRQTKQFDAIGLHAENVSCNFEVLMQRKDAVVRELRSGVEKLIQANRVDLFRGTGALSGPGEVSVTGGEGTEKIFADKILIATGSVPAKPKIPGSDLPNVVTSDDLLEGTGQCFRRLVIIGGGVIGAEFATAFRDLDCEVTVIEAMPRILPVMDREISQNLSMILKKRGVRIITNAKVEKISGERSLVCYFLEKDISQAVEADGILISVGRRPNTNGLFSGEFHVEMDRGRILTDEHFETSQKGLFAVGDVIGGIQLAHAASAQGIAAVEYMAGIVPTVHPEVIPSCVYTDPEIASVGLTADEAKNCGTEVKIGKFLMSANAKSLIELQERGFIKLVFDAKNEVLLGAQLMCARATDLVAELTQAIVNKMTAQQIVSVVRAHPTFSEGVTEAAADVIGRAVNAMPKRGINNNVQ